jgi:hypothetical protein
MNLQRVLTLVLYALALILLVYILVCLGFVLYEIGTLPLSFLSALHVVIVLP